MAASDSIHATAPSLLHSQRTRLLKSSRKIEAMLGTTPLVLPDVDLSPLAKPRLERSKSKPGKGPQPVLLRSRSVALPSLIPSSPHVKPSSLDTADATSGPSTPLSGLFAKETNDAKEREMRRRKMAKITRTLGENIPPELVFGSSYNSNTSQQETRYSSPKNAAGKPHRPGRLSVSSSSNSNSRSAEVIQIVDNTKPDAIEQSGEVTPTAATTYTASTSSLSLTSTSSSGHDHNVTISSAPFSPSATSATTPTASTFYYHYTKASSHHTLPTPTSTGATVHRSRSQRTIAGCYPVYHAGPSVSSTPVLASNTLEPVPEPSPPFTASSLSPTIDSYGSSSPLHRAASTSSSMAPLLQRHESATATPVVGARSAKSLDVQRSSTFTNFQDLHDYDTSNGARNPTDYVWGTRRQKGATQVYTYGRHEENVGADEDAGGARKKEKEWSGEWNVKDMGDVVKKLRELKGR